MKIYLLLDDENIIISYFNEKLSDNLKEVEINDLKSIHVGFSKFENNKIVSCDKDYQYKAKIEKAVIEIGKLKNNLQSTDYKILKHAEGNLSEEEYQSIITQRQEWRNKISEYELIVNGGK